MIMVMVMMMMMMTMMMMMMMVVVTVMMRMIIVLLLLIAVIAYVAPRYGSRSLLANAKTRRKQQGTGIRSVTGIPVGVKSCEV